MPNNDFSGFHDQRGRLIVALHPARSAGAETAIPPATATNRTRETDATGERRQPQTSQSLFSTTANRPVNSAAGPKGEILSFPQKSNAGGLLANAPSDLETISKAFEFL
jgi:hypothetical protein